MKSVIPYLQFNGDCAAAFNLYRSVFGGEFHVEKRISEFLSYDTEVVIDAPVNEVTYLTLVADKITIMGSDNVTPANHNSNSTCNVYLAIKTESKSESDKIFSLLAEGGKAIISMQEVSSKEYYGSLIDRFGIKWVISFDLPG